VEEQELKALQVFKVLQAQRAHKVLQDQGQRVLKVQQVFKVLQAQQAHKAQQVQV
jgi:hypothetical protein